MFFKCSSLTSFNLSNFNTVNNMKSMFYNCSSLTSLNLSIFNFNNVKDIFDMFSGLNKKNCQLICNDKKIKSICSNSKIILFLLSIIFIFE